VIIAARRAVEPRGRGRPERHISVRAERRSGVAKTYAGNVSVSTEQLRIVTYPAGVLKKRAAPMVAVTPQMRTVAMQMLTLMHLAKGIGLAAPQVGLSWRMFVVEIPEDAEDERSAWADPPTATDGPLVFINPVLSRPEGDLEPFEEGCLSLPEIRGEVMRPSVITVRAMDLEGKPFELRAGGLLARCVQHEFDHLEGTLIIDRMTQVSRLKVRSKVRALERDG